jgi:hypothetical protein
MSFSSKTKTGVIQESCRSKNVNREHKAEMKGRLNPQVMAMFKTPRSGLMRTAMERIALAPLHQKKLRTKDKKAIFRYYNRNQSIHQMMKCSKNKEAEGTGTCGAESLNRMNDEINIGRQHMRVQIQLSCEEFPDHPKKSINHYAVIYKDGDVMNDTKWRYESYGNGKHLDTTLFFKLLHQNCLSMTITNSNLEMEEEFEIIEMFRLFQKDMRERKGMKDVDKFGFSFSGERGEGMTALNQVPYVMALAEWRKRFCGPKATEQHWFN